MTEDAVIRELQRLDTRLSCLDKKLDAVRAEDLPMIREDLAALKVKAGVWGFAAGSLPTIAALLFYLLQHRP